MNELESLPKIFLSYAWINSNIADEIDNDFKAVGINLMRDIRDAKYRSSIKEFMERIGETDFVLMIISDEFLKSENCMYEVTELLNTHEFNKRILPVVLDNAKVFKASQREEYYNYWKNEIKLAEKRKKQHPNLDYTEQARRCKSIYDYMDDFFREIIDLNVLTYQKLKSENYKQMLDIIGFDDDKILETAIEISKIEDKEEKDLAIENFIEKYHNNWHGYFLRALVEQENNQYKKAKSHYEQLIKKFPKIADAHYNLGILLEDYCKDFKGAKFRYEKACEFNPNHTSAHCNLAIVLKNHFEDYIGAKSHYEKAIQINPNYAIASYNLAILLVNHFKDYNGAKLNYEKAIQINPDYASAHNNLATLLETHFEDYEGAKNHYEKASVINPLDADIYINLAYLLKNHFNNLKKSKGLYLEAVKLDPSQKTPERDKDFGVR